MKHIFPDYRLQYVDIKEENGVYRHYKFLTHVRIERDGKYYYVLVVNELRRVSTTDVDDLLNFIKRCISQCYIVIHLHEVNNDIECSKNYSEKDRLKQALDVEIEDVAQATLIVSRHSL
jgi:hypothetical protein